MQNFHFIFDIFALVLIFKDYLYIFTIMKVNSYLNSCLLGHWRHPMLVQCERKGIRSFKTCLNIQPSFNEENQHQHKTIWNLCLKGLAQQFGTFTYRLGLLKHGKVTPTHLRTYSSKSLLTYFWKWPHRKHHIFSYANLFLLN